MPPINLVPSCQLGYFRPRHFYHTVTLALGSRTHWYWQQENQRPGSAYLFGKGFLATIVRGDMPAPSELSQLGISQLGPRTRPRSTMRRHTNEIIDTPQPSERNETLLSITCATENTDLRLGNYFPFRALAIYRGRDDWIEWLKRLIAPTWAGRGTRCRYLNGDPTASGSIHTGNQCFFCSHRN
jgi:hypothetical protein